MPMFNISHNIFANDKDRIAKLLRTSPEALERFEKAYAASCIDGEGVLGVNSRKAASMKSDIELTETAAALRRRVVDELLAQTRLFTYDGAETIVEPPSGLPDGLPPVTREEILALPVPMRPQVSGELMKVDITDEMSYRVLAFYCERYQNAKSDKERMSAIHHFYQGLDILDLDPVTYRIIGTNPNSMGHWFPQLVDACRGTSFFRIPKTTIATVPMTLLQLTHTEYGELTAMTLGIVDDWAREAFRLDENEEYFIKTGTYSSKFDFRNCHVHGAKEVRELGEYLLYIHHQALQMASPLNRPVIYGASTTNEWVVREFIADKEANSCIYNGLPLHTEYRVFVDCDTDTVLGITPYWEAKTMKNRFANEGDINSPHQKHDYVIYAAHEETLMRRYEANRDKVVEHIREILPALDLPGQWSIDIMQNGDDFWLIDMALAENSFFYRDCVPPELRKPAQWMREIPQLPTNTI